MSQAETWYWQRNWSDFRRGQRRIKVEWDSGEGEIVLYDEGVPKTTAAFVSRLPVDIPVVHVAWSGDMVMSATPVPMDFREEENLTRLVRPGDVAFDPKYNEITVTYGTAEARLPSGPNTLTVFGQVDSGLVNLARWARARRFEGVGVLRFSTL